MSHSLQDARLNHPAWIPQPLFLRSMGMRVRPQGSDSIVSVPQSKQKLVDICPTEEVESDSGTGSSTEMENEFAQAHLHSDSDEEELKSSRKGQPGKKKLSTLKQLTSGKQMLLSQLKFANSFMLSTSLRSQVSSVPPKKEFVVA